MRIIICGAGQVGYNIAAYLARENNDITVIDNDHDTIEQLNNDLDVNTFWGHASDPEILSQAGIKEADMIIAVTHSDEVNMVACQVAHSLFSVPKKVARIRNQTYLDSAWSNLFSRSNLPIDVTISPEIEVAKDINQRLATPGTSNIMSFCNDKINLASVICREDCPIINTQLKQLPVLFPDLELRISLISRKGKHMIPGPDDQLQIGDEVFFFCEAQLLHRTMAIFGQEEKEARNIVIIGGGNIGFYLANLVQNEHKGANIKIIEYNEERAIFISEKLPNVTVINGDALDHDILDEARIDKAETLIAVSNDDETNLLGSLLAKQYGCERAITLVNKTTYSGLMSHLGIDAVVSPKSSTVSKIMENVRRGRIKGLHTVADGNAEIIEAEISDVTSFANMPLNALDLPEGVVIGALIRKNEDIGLQDETIIRPGDRILILSLQKEARKIEKLLSAQVDFF